MADYTADGYIVAPTVDVVAPVADPYTVSPNFRGGYYGEQTGSTGGGYDPNNPSYGNQSNSVGGDVAVTQNYAGAPVFAGGYYGDQEDSGGGGYDPGLSGLDDPTNARNSISGLKEGGANSDPATNPSVAFQSATGAGGEASSSEVDWRVRISLAESAKIFYKEPNSKNAIMAPLIDTNGVIFPYTPSITVTHSANYSPANPTHSNYPQQVYNNSEVQDITITGEFTVQSVEEGQYLMAAIYFFRSATKMFFGSGAYVGNPPPVVFLDGYGSHYFPHVPCVVSGFSHVLSNDVDYVQIPVVSSYLQDVPVQNDNMNIGSVQLTPEEQQYIPGLLQSNKQATTASTQATVTKSATTKTQFQTITSNSRVPTNSQISITLKPVYSRANMHYRFDLNKFAAGQLLRDKKKGYGGFL